MRKTKFLLMVVVMVVAGINSFGQPGSNPGGGGPPGSVPISGIEILIGIGSLFGASRFLKLKNKSKES